VIGVLNRGAQLALQIASSLGPGPKPSTGILVLGMHRSGTSALTRIVNLLGVPVGREEDLMSADAANAAGYWESGSLTDFQELLLERLGGSWEAPPDLPSGWERSPRLLVELGRARRLFRRVYGRPTTWVWKDPRTSLTLPFWLRALRPRVIAIVVYRNPLEVARSLAARNEMPKERALALWEIYNRALLANAEAFPALIVSYEDLLRDPAAVAGRLETFLASNGLRNLGLPREDVESFVDPSLRHSEFDATLLDADSDVTPSQRELFLLLRSLDGSHQRLGSALSNRAQGVIRGS
jgi:hypothetical protein